MQSEKVVKMVVCGDVQSCHDAPPATALLTSRSSALNSEKTSFYWPRTCSAYVLLSLACVVHDTCNAGCISLVK